MNNDYQDIIREIERVEIRQDSQILSMQRIEQNQQELISGDIEINNNLERVINTSLLISIIMMLLVVYMFITKCWRC